MESTQANKASKGRRLVTASVFASMTALALVFLLGVGHHARGAATLRATSLETYESDSVAAQASSAAETSESDSISSAKAHPELILQLD